MPSGPPLDVVRRSADLTLSAGPAQVFVDGPDGRHSEGTLRGTMRRTGPSTGVDRPEYTDPAAVLTLVRYAEHVDPFGGLLVRGAGTIRYDVNLHPPGQAPFFADVYVDSRGRIRRLTVPDDRGDHRVTDKEVRLARLITIDVVYR